MSNKVIKIVALTATLAWSGVAFAQGVGDPGIGPNGSGPNAADGPGPNGSNDGMVRRGGERQGEPVTHENGRMEDRNMRQ